jgi:hypothetical protein
MVALLRNIDFCQEILSEAMDGQQAGDQLRSQVISFSNLILSNFVLSAQCLDM